jgi:hypothetical protein
MAVGCVIGKLEDSGLVYSIRVRDSGHPMFAGRDLLESYSSDKAVWGLINTGNRHHMFVPYLSRRHGTKHRLDSWELKPGTQWAYLWRDGAWQVSEVSRDCRELGPWEPLADVVARLEVK